MTPNWREQWICCGQCCHTEEPRQAGETGQEEPYEIQRGQMQSSCHLGMLSPCIRHAGDDWFYSKGSGEHQECALAAKKVVERAQPGAWGKGLCSCSAPVRPHLGTVSFWALSRKGSEKLEPSLAKTPLPPRMVGVRVIWGGAKGTEFIQPGEEMASGERDSSLPAPVRVSSRRQNQALLSGKLSGGRARNSRHKLKQKHSAWY